MSLMVSPVSRLSFGNGAQAAAQTTAAPDNVSVEDLLNRQGAFARPVDATAADEKAPKKHTALKVVAGIIVAAAVVAGALYGLKTKFPEVFDATKKFADFGDAKFLDKVKGYTTTAIAKAGEWVGNTCASIKKSVTGLFGKGKTETAAAENATEAVNA